MPRIDLGDVALNVELAGEGPPLILLHGLAGCAQDWSAEVARLAPRFRTVAVDLIGHGDSDAPADPLRYSIAHAVADLAGLLDCLDIGRASWLGYSMGGRVALAFACVAPERVERLVLESASPGIADEAVRGARRVEDEALAARIERDGVEAFVDEWLARPLFATQAARVHGEALAALRARRIENRAVGLANSLRGMGVGAQAPLWDRLGQMRAPALLVAGEDDVKFWALAAEMAEWLPRARVAIVARAGHNAHLENPIEFAERVEEFLLAPEAAGR